MVLVFGLVGAGMPRDASAATHKKKHPRSTHKSSQVKSKHTTTAASRKSSGSHKSSKKRTASSRKGKRRKVASTPKRSFQRNPTPERYKEIQEALIAKGYLKGPATGAWDSDSIEAIKRFQTDQKLDADGKLEALTLIALGLGPKNSPIANNSQAPAR